jgi:uncharacterized ferritin-like protein (DUF455 family)
LNPEATSSPKGPARWDLALLGVLETADAGRKAALAQDLLTRARAGDLDLAGAAQVVPNDRPARPERPALVAPGAVPRRGIGTVRGRAALFHALAHIELNAIDLAADMALRFAGEIPDEKRAWFVADWIEVMGEEGLHFSMLAESLAAMGAGYGDFDAHDGLWEAAMLTRHDLLGRLAVAPMILEARGLDVTPDLIRRLEGLQLEAEAAVLTRIYEDEIGHVRCGVRWFTAVTEDRGLDPEETFHDRVARFHPQGPKPPFNVWARTEATLPQDWYENLVPH